MSQVTKILKSMAGEYLVAAYLCNQGYFVAVTPKGMPRADLIVYDLRNGRATLVQVKAFSWSNRCPLIGVRASYDDLDKVLEEKIVYPYVFVRLHEDLSRVEFYVLSPSQVRKLAKRGYMEWLSKESHCKPLEELKKTKQPLCISIDKLEEYKDAWDNIWRE